MGTSIRPLVMLACLGLATLAGCEKATASPDMATRADEEFSSPPPTRGDEESFGDSNELDGAEGDSAADRWSEPLPALAERPVAKEKCRGAGKRKKCTVIDPNPGLSAAHGVRDIMGDFRFGMSPRDVFKRLSAGIEVEFKKRLEGEDDAVKQDEIRRWRRQQLEAIKSNHVKFESKAAHRWGASIIRFEFADDEGEEMIISDEGNLKKYFFFRNGELWKTLFAFDVAQFGSKAYSDVLKSDFQERFGQAPAAKSAIDEKSKARMIDYHEWQTTDGDVVRAFDLGKIHGAYVVAVIDGKVEKNLGVRLPHASADAGVTSEVTEVEGGSDVCYDEAGEMITDAERCKKIRGF
jgi:hypothetical protein